MVTLIGIQDEYIATILAAKDRWGHRPKRANQPCGGHFNRICRGAHTKALAALQRIGFSVNDAERAIADAWDMAKLEMASE